MVARSSQSEQDSLNALLQGALLLDLEVSHQGKILRLGAVLGDLALARAGSGSGEGTFNELNHLAQRADCLLGHNLVRHDLPVLRERAPDLPIHRLPVTDTLMLSPICFPENPYHRLVKDYKLVAETLNAPIADPPQASVSFAEDSKPLGGL